MKCRSLVLVLGVSVAMLLAGGVEAATTCAFTDIGMTRNLDADCTTDATLLVPNGFTFDGQGNTITAKDPPGNHFRGAVIKNAGSVAHVKNVIITTKGLADVCDGPANPPMIPTDDRLRGILFDGASGSIVNNAVVNVNQGASSGCQEGNSIEVRNAPFDGTHPGTRKVLIRGNLVSGFMKTGIVCNGDVECSIRRNSVSASANQFSLAANSVQVGFGGAAEVEHNSLDGNQFLGDNTDVGTAILAFCPARADIHDNVITGNSDVGIFLVVDDEFCANVNGVVTGVKGVKVSDNTLFDVGVDGPSSDISIDVGIFDFGRGNRIVDNVVIGFESPTDADPRDNEIKGTRTRFDDKDDDHDQDHKRHRHGRPYRSPRPERRGHY